MQLGTKGELKVENEIADENNDVQQATGIQQDISRISMEINQKVQKCLVMNRGKIWKPNKVEFGRSTLNYLKSRDPDFGKEIM